MDNIKRTVTMTLEEFKKQEKYADLGRAIELAFKEPSSTLLIEPVKETNGNIDHFDVEITSTKGLSDWAKRNY